MHRGHRHPPRRRGRAAGFSLVEVAVALIIFAIGFLSLAALIPLGTKGVSKSGESTRASEIASATMERLLSTPYSDPDLGSGAHADPSNPYPGDYHVTWNVEEDQPEASCKRITVRVRWPLSSSTTMVRMVGVKTEAGG